MYNTNVLHIIVHILITENLMYEKFTLYIYIYMYNCTWLKWYIFAIKIHLLAATPIWSSPLSQSSIYAKQNIDGNGNCLILRLRVTESNTIHILWMKLDTWKLTNVSERLFANEWIHQPCQRIFKQGGW